MAVVLSLKLIIFTSNEGGSLPYHSFPSIIVQNDMNMPKKGIRGISNIGFFEKFGLFDGNKFWFVFIEISKKNNGNCIPILRAPSIIGNL